MEPPTYLANKNKHELDSHILFDEPTHVYTIDGDSDYMSATTFVHSHFGHFDADKIIDKMMKGRNWKPGYKYYGMTKEEIKEMWSQNGKEASEAGTKMHYDIECFYNECPNENNSIEYQYFKNFQEAYSHLIPFRTEWTVFDKELKIAGSIDMIFQNEDGSLQIYDWKRCKDISKTTAYMKYSKNKIISHIPDTNFWHYSLQLNVYKFILEKNYGVHVTDLYLVCLHPNKENYRRIKVADLSQEVKDLFQQRKEHVNGLISLVESS